MVRPVKERLVNFKPNIVYFKPSGVPLRQLEEEQLTFDELEAIRLSDVERLSQSDSAELMNVHQSTFQRTLSRARTKLAHALINGRAIKIIGGNFKMPNGDGTGPEGKGRRTGRGKGLCSGNDKPGRESDEQPRMGLGRGPRDGSGRGLRNFRGRNSQR